MDIGNTNEEIVKNSEVINRIQEEVDFYNEKFGHWEKIKKFELTPEVWSIENDQLTPTMKLKRRNIKERYMDLYNAIYER